MFNCERQFLELVNLELYDHRKILGGQGLSPVCFCDVQAGMNLILMIKWKLIINKKKAYLDTQVNPLVQNTRTKEKQLQKLQMSAKKKKIEWR